MQRGFAAMGKAIRDIPQLYVPVNYIPLFTLLGDRNSLGVTGNP